MLSVRLESMRFVVFNQNLWWMRFSARWFGGILNKAKLSACACCRAKSAFWSLHKLPRPNNTSTFAKKVLSVHQFVSMLYFTLCKKCALAFPSSDLPGSVCMPLCICVMF